MADIVETLASLVLCQEYRGDVVRQINRKATTLKTLRIVPGAGQNVAQVSEGDGAVAEQYSDGADAANFGQDAQSAAIWKWGLYRALIHISDFARQTAASSPTPGALRNLVGRNIANGTAKAASLINQAMYTGNGSGQAIAGFDQAYQLANTYGTIDRTQTQNAYWTSSVFDPGALTPLSFAQIRGDIGAIYDLSGEVPDLGFVSTGVYNTIASLFDANRRYVYEIQTGRGVVKLDAGYGALEIDGCFFVRDKDAPANSIYYVNSDHTSVEYLPLPPEIIAALQEMGVDLTLNDGYGPIPLGINWANLAKLGASERKQGLVTCALRVDRPNAGGVRRNVQIAS
jgi:hypothetical protein